MKKLEVGNFIYTYSEYYGHTIYEVVNVGRKCQYCNDRDYVTLQIVSNNNFGYDGTLDRFFPYNQKKVFVIYDFQKNIAKSIKKNQMTLFNSKQSAVLRQQLLNNEWN